MNGYNERTKRVINKVNVTERGVSLKTEVSHGKNVWTKSRSFCRQYFSFTGSRGGVSGAKMNACFVYPA